MGKEVKPEGILTFLTKHFVGFKDLVTIMIVVSLLGVVCKVSTPVIMQIMLDDVLSGINPEWGAPLIAFAGAICLFELIVRIPESMTWRQTLTMNISSKSEYFWHALRLPISFYSDKYAADIAGRINYGSDITRSLNSLFFLCGDIVLLAIYLYFMIRYSAILSIFAILHIVINLVIVKSVHKKQVESNKRMQKEIDTLKGFAAAGIENIDAIKGASGEKVFFNKWSKKFAVMQNAVVDCTSRSLKMEIIPLLIESVSSVLVLGIGVWYIIKGYLTVGMLMTFQSFMSSCMKPVSNVIQLEQYLASIKVKSERMNEVFTTECDVPDTLDSIDDVTDGKLRGEIELKNVTFGYDKNLPPVISNFSLHILPGQSVAFVGGSGSGKSTIAKLISGLYKPWSGEVLFDGKPIDQVNREVFANSVSVVNQNIVLFDGSISENIKMWDNSVEDFAMIMACHDAQIHNDIVIRKGAYSAPIESGGKNFSGGQRQRLELASAFAKEPSVMIMDEGTSALDAVTENAVMRSIKNTGCSQIIIAHRLSTIRNCDEIIVLKDGGVEERGTHEKLIANKGYYSRLVEN